MNNLRHVGRTSNLPFASNLHATDSNIPALDNLTTTKPELEGFAGITLVEYLLVWSQTPNIVNRHLQHRRCVKEGQTLADSEKDVTRMLSSSRSLFSIMGDDLPSCRSWLRLLCPPPGPHKPPLLASPFWVSEVTCLKKNKVIMQLTTFKISSIVFSFSNIFLTAPPPLPAGWFMDSYISEVKRVANDFSSDLVNLFCANHNSRLVW